MSFYTNKGLKVEQNKKKQTKLNKPSDELFKDAFERGFKQAAAEQGSGAMSLMGLGNSAAANMAARKQPLNIPSAPPISEPTAPVGIVPEVPEFKSPTQVASNWNAEQATPVSDIVQDIIANDVPGSVPMDQLDSGGVQAAFPPTGDTNVTGFNDQGFADGTGTIGGPEATSGSWPAWMKALAIAGGAGLAGVAGYGGYKALGGDKAPIAPVEAVLPLPSVKSKKKSMNKKSEEVLSEATLVGFVKAAKENGLNDAQVIALLKTASPVNYGPSYGNVPPPDVAEYGTDMYSEPSAAAQYILPKLIQRAQQQQISASPVTQQSREGISSIGQFMSDNGKYIAGGAAGLGGLGALLYYLKNKEEEEKKQVPVLA
jgi:hypothetical protein